MYRQKRNYENLEKAIYSGIGVFGIPEIQPTQYDGGCEFIGFNYAIGCKDTDNKESISSWMITSLTGYGKIRTDICLF